MRKEKKIKISADNRDKGKTFLLTEMPAMRIERWATRAFLALAKGGVHIPPDIAAQGLAGVAQMGLEALSGLQPDVAEPLLDEMMECVQIVESETVTRSLTPDDIEEVSTILQLRAEVFTLHTGFSWADIKSKLTSATISAGLSNTETSQEA